jgi:superfamily II RNA helicase
VCVRADSVTATSVVPPLRSWLVDPALLHTQTHTQTHAQTQPAPAAANTAATAAATTATAAATAAAHPHLARAALTLSRQDADADGMVSLAAQTVIGHGRSVIVFCPTKSWCDRAATLIAQALGTLREAEQSTILTLLGAASSSTSSGSGSSSGGSSPAPAPALDRALCLSRLSAEAGRGAAAGALLASLQQCAAGVCPVLLRTLPQGVAYHHAGLTLEERRVVEGGFRSGAVSVLCATSTLAAGVRVLWVL